MNKHRFIFTLLCLIISFTTLAQIKVAGTVFNEANQPIQYVMVYNIKGGLLAETNAKGVFQFTTDESELKVIFYSELYKIKELIIDTQSASNLRIVLAEFEEELTEVTVKARRAKAFQLKRLRDVEGTAIYAGKKTEVVLVDQSAANLATNNARQIYNRIAGLNIYQNDDGGLQLNIGGRGLDPNRTSNFNTRQNGYDISADVLGYPESYYTPASEGLQEIQIIRGAASLQYGTQFGGLVNFVTKKPNPNKPFEVITRNTAGSFGLYTNFTSLSGTKDKVAYYAYFNYKSGDGFRPNSGFDSKNAFAHVEYKPDDKNTFSFELTYLDYLAQQAGGLSDQMFETDPLQSNRTRNWFDVDWFLYNLKWAHEFSEKSRFTFNFFGLNASRKAVGFRVRRVDLADPGGARELLVSDFNNFGFETRFLSEYKIGEKKATYLIGAKFYKADNTDDQGPGTDRSDADFSSAADQFPNYSFVGSFENPNLNIALFGENIFYLSDEFSITPGARLEYIKTESNGFSRRTNFDGAGNPIGNETVDVDEAKERSFLLLGIGASYKPNTSIEFYGNVSQNYRSITFSDVNIVNPSNAVDPNLDDENGFTMDIGMRGNWNDWLSYDVGAFGLFYKDRIGFLFTQIPPVNNLGQLRTNIGDARILGIESLFDFNLKKILKLDDEFSFNYFINTSFITSEYTRAITNGIVGNQVEFIPDVNLKTGVSFGYKNFSSSIQYTYLSQQFTDAANSTNPDVSGIVGVIPSYDILDVSFAYKYKFLKLETGVNNLLDNAYFTRRATGYPGPGIIPSAPRNYYVTIQVKL
jgi:Fe(3+) dicitrate transport protein